MKPASIFFNQFFFLKQRIVQYNHLHGISSLYVAKQNTFIWILKFELKKHHGREMRSFWHSTKKK